jgi:hypothetical protein
LVQMRKTGILYFSCDAFFLMKVERIDREKKIWKKGFFFYKNPYGDQRK